jgi:leucyl-tRNA synthetase
LFYRLIVALDIPGYGSTAAVSLCEQHNIVSSKEKDKLKLAKDEVYLKGFYEGVLLVGDCKDMKVRPLPTYMPSVGLFVIFVGL